MMNFYILMHFCLLKIAVVFCFQIGVVEYEEPYHDINIPSTIIRDNFQHMSVLIKLAAYNKTNVIIFPECSLGGYKTYGLSKDQLRQYAYKLPNQETSGTSLSTSDYKREIKQMSIKASDNGVYIISNVIERTEMDDFYNTNIVFDDKGTFLKSIRNDQLISEENHSDVTLEKCNITLGQIDFCIISSTVLFDEDLMKKINHPNNTKIIITNANYREEDIPEFLNKFVVFKHFALKYDKDVIYAGLKGENATESEIKNSGIFSKNVNNFNCPQYGNQLLYGGFDNRGVLGCSFETDIFNDYTLDDWNKHILPCEQKSLKLIDVKGNESVFVCYEKNITISNPDVNKKTEIQISLIGIVFTGSEEINGTVITCRDNKYTALLIDRKLQYYTGKHVLVNEKRNEIDYQVEDPNVYFLGCLLWNIKKDNDNRTKNGAGKDDSNNNPNSANPEKDNDESSLGTVIIVIVVLLVVSLIIVIFYCYIIRRKPGAPPYEPETLPLDDHDFRKN